MTGRMISALLLGLVGVALLCSLGVWQVQRMHWKAGVLAAIDAMIVAEPADLPAVQDPQADRYRPVRFSGRFTGAVIEVLSGLKDVGPGVRVIEAFETAAGRRILVDRGFLADEARALPRPPKAAEVLGNLHWPQDADAYTPPPDAKTGLWFARDVPAMAQALGTEAVFVVARKPTGDGILPVPVDSASIPNDHWGYAITWFSMAFAWAGMTVFLLWRIRQQTVGK